MSGKRIVALAGGVGGAKLAWGLAQILSPQELTIIVNTGDDFMHLGLDISPDVDTVCYTLANLANPQTGWGRQEESWNCLQELKRFDAPGWFNLGDRDFALHLVRSQLRREGKTLTEITRFICDHLGVKHSILPMTDSPVRTVVNTKEYGELPFQEYFVKYQCQPTVTGVQFKGIQDAYLSGAGEAALSECDAVVICPSNPWVSIDPILGIHKVREILAKKTVIAISPIINGETIKGPAAKMYSEMGIEPSALAVAKHYRGILNGIIIDTIDSNLTHPIDQCGIIPIARNTLMSDNLKRIELAKETVAFLERFTKE